MERSDLPRLPPLNAKQRPKHIIEYAKTTRQAVLKYLAILRWKTSVDLAAATSGQPAAPGAASFPTPISNDDSASTSPAARVGKGKGKMVDVKGRGKVTDSKRIQQFLEHQNKQHEDAITHIKHTARVVDGLR
jgi:mediator of RNA polymerase II transcription subunit 14